MVPYYNIEPPYSKDMQTETYLNNNGEFLFEKCFVFLGGFFVFLKIQSFGLFFLNYRNYCQEPRIRLRSLSYVQQIKMTFNNRLFLHQHSQIM